MADQGVSAPEGAAPTRPGWRGWAQLALVVVVVAIAYYFARAPGVDSVADGGFAEAPSPRPEVAVVRPSAGPAARQVAATGVVSVVGGVALRSQVAGEAVFVSPALRPGAAISAGQPLVRIDRRDYELRLEAAQAQVRRAEAQLEKVRLKGETRRQRFLRDNPGAAVPPLVAKLPQIAREEAEVARTRVAVEKAEVDLGRTTLRAPFDGWVRATSLQAGQVVGPGTAFAQVFAKDAVRVEARLSAADMAALGECAAGTATGNVQPTATDCRAPPVIGHAAKVRAGGRAFDAVVERVSAVVDLESRLATLFMRFAESIPPDALPRPGTFATVTLDGPPLGSVFVLPEAAQQDDGSVWIVVDGALKRFAPRGLGRNDAGWLVAPFDLGQGVVAGPVAGAREGLPVTPRTGGAGS